MRLVVYCRWLSPSLSVDTRGFVLLTHYPWFDIIRVTFEKSCFPEACFLLVGWPKSVWCLNLLDEGLKANEEIGQSLTKHLSWPFIPSKINLPLMCPYYCTDFNLLHPIKASPPGDTIHCRCVVFHLDSNNDWLSSLLSCSSRTLKGQVNSATELWRSFAHQMKQIQPKQTGKVQEVEIPLSIYLFILNAVVNLYFEHVGFALSMTTVLFILFSYAWVQNVDDLLCFYFIIGVNQKCLITYMEKAMHSHLHYVRQYNAILVILCVVVIFLPKNIMFKWLSIGKDAFAYRIVW